MKMKTILAGNVRSSLEAFIKPVVKLNSVVTLSAHNSTLNAVIYGTHYSDCFISSITLPAGNLIDGEVSVKVSDLAHALKGKGEIVIQEESGFIKVSTGSTSLALPPVTEQELENSVAGPRHIVNKISEDPSTTLNIKSENLLEMVKAVTPSMYKTPLKEHLKALLFEVEGTYLRAVCTDGSSLASYTKRVSVVSGEEEFKENKLLISDSSAIVLQKVLEAVCKKGFVGGDAVVSMGLCKGGLTIKCGQIETVFPFTDVSFPVHYKRVFPDQSSLNYAQGVSMKEFLESLNSISSVFGRNYHKEMLIKIHPGTDYNKPNLELLSQAEGSMEANLFVSVDTFQKNIEDERDRKTGALYSPLSFGKFNGKLLKKLLSGVKKSGKMSIGMGKAQDYPAVITAPSGDGQDLTEGFYGLIMPIRL